MSSSTYLKLYIAVLDTAPDFMVPTLVAHTMLGAHLHYQTHEDSSLYDAWLTLSFRKCVVKVNQKEFDKISKLHEDVYLGHENTILDGNKSCAIPLPVFNGEIPNVLKFAKL